MSASPAHTILVHPHPLEREAVAGWLRGQSFVELIGMVPDLPAVEKLPYLSEIELITLFAYEPDDVAAQIIRLKRGSPLLKILILTTQRLNGGVHDLIRAGANGLIELGSEIDEWERAIRAIIKGQVYYSQPVMLRLATHAYAGLEPAATIGKNVLSTREIEILVMVANEYSSPEIAAELCISEKTVESHRRNLFQKLSVKNAVGLTKAAVRLGLI